MGDADGRRRPGALWRDTVPGLIECEVPEMVTLPRGQFLMGTSLDDDLADDDERPQHTVDIGYTFALGRYPVTFAEWDAAIDAGAKLISPADRGWGRDKFPVTQVSWDDAQAYVAWLSASLRLDGKVDAYRLPSEAEWEFACRAGTDTAFSCGDTISSHQANFNDAHYHGRPHEREERSTPVGSFPPNPFGLHDMHGNVWEWCADRWHDTYDDADRPDDGAAWLTGESELRILRGGSWLSPPRSLRSPYRIAMPPRYKNAIIGFRVARTL